MLRLSIFPLLGSDALREESVYIPKPGEMVRVDALLHKIHGGSPTVFVGETLTVSKVEPLFTESHLQRLEYAWLRLHFTDGRFTHCRVSSAVSEVSRWALLLGHGDVFGPPA